MILSRKFDPGVDAVIIEGTTLSRETLKQNIERRDT
jgi:hypothetical protein